MPLSQESIVRLKATFISCLCVFTFEYARSDAQRKILLIGDSHIAASYGQGLTQDLIKLYGNKVFTVGRGGSSPDWWVPGFTNSERDATSVFDYPIRASSHRTPLLEELILKSEHMQEPVQLILVELGANLMGTSSAFKYESVHALLQKIKSLRVPCVWIGPPLGQNKIEALSEFNELYQLLQTQTANICLGLIDSRPATRLPQGIHSYPGDGRHFDQMGDLGKLLTTQWKLSTLEQLNFIIK